MMAENLFSKTIIWQRQLSVTADNSHSKTSRPRRYRRCESLCTHTKKDEQLSLLVLIECHDVLDHRTFIDDYFKILDFIEWLKEYYPDKAKFLTEKS
jgi:hypothetical protein